MTNRELFWYNFLKPEYNQISPIELSNSIQRKKVVRINKNNINNILVYDGVNIAARNNNITKTAIYNVINKKRNTANGYYWCHYDDYKNFQPPMDDGNNGNRRQKIKVLHNNQIKIYQSISQFSKANNLDRGAVSRGLNKNGKYRDYIIEKI